MAADTYGDLWRKVLLRAPAVPASLAKDFLKDAYREVTKGRRWGWMRAETILQTQASRGVMCTCTLGSATVTSAAGFVAGDLGRQWRLANQPVYTIAAYIDASTITLDRVYADPANVGSQAATILDAYVAMPEDFQSFRTLVNPTTQLPMPWWYDTETLDFYDPARIMSDSTARLVAAWKIGTADVAGVLGRVLYEWYPYPSGAYGYPATYYKRADTPADTDTLKGVLATSGDLLVTGALAECAQWPGTTERPNPYFNLGLAKRLRDDFAVSMQDLAVEDDDQMITSISQTDWRGLNSVFPVDTRQLRATDATLGDYFGGF